MQKKIGNPSSPDSNIRVHLILKSRCTGFWNSGAPDFEMQGTNELWKTVVLVCDSQ